MTLLNPLLFFLVLFTGCQHPKAVPNQPVAVNSNDNLNPYTHIGAIPVPPGYTRISVRENSFAHWLRQVPLKPDKTVYTFNGQRKANQQAAYAVADISTGKKDLQQCADAVMRLRAEYLYGRELYTHLDFIDNENKHYIFHGASRHDFEHYLEKIFAYCGSLSLSRQLLKVNDFSQIQPGDVLIKGGSPGHAMTVMDVAANSRGEKIYLLSQSYMPAQDIHVVINPKPETLSPWYVAGKEELIETPEWNFKMSELKRWPAAIN